MEHSPKQAWLESAEMKRIEQKVPTMTVHLAKIRQEMREGSDRIAAALRLGHSSKSR
jgi:hypothetical protein